MVLTVHFFNVIDTQPPKLLKCPAEDIIKTTSLPKIKVSWDNRIEYSDNCGSYNECRLDIDSKPPSGSEFLRGSTNKVTTEAVDPSGNRNEKCIFNVIIKGGRLLIENAKIVFSL